jgi:hypothetical protein
MFIVPYLLVQLHVRCVGDEWEVHHYATFPGAQPNALCA